MKKAFTMMELAFVIVFLAIIASIAIPKLLATRGDTSAAIASAEMGRIVTELRSYYIANGSFAGNLKNIDTQKNANIISTMSPTYKEVYDRRYKSGGNGWLGSCVTISLWNGDAANEAHIRFGEYGMKKDSYCQAVRGTPAYKQFKDGNGLRKKGSTYINDKGKTENLDAGNGKVGVIFVSGTRIFTE
ncbi:type IV pilin protein [Campylobacter hyointestinalis]|uniref:type IV pilin protein n=1 Tax=Campylobacter hyointestinalis TaxID=198 RepID=UPI002554CC55|nr:type II secretion system protein [Campylobacter hyointestinalis]MDL2346414.1 type II secretion system protein [Campylobacter hyointestinalis]MDL2348154.1 type II secretion system protein [Campylobacter hyointestinalis]MDL2349899.1 type II secretion system protein [Campylobacter hyointestinalis]MDM1025424.1 type II secretion system protein [Campylobacter hyointestinalis]MDM1027905.1 type II secretion system protein [Campylobacter hyointestinalis]